MRRVTTAVVLGAALAAVLSGCGGGGDSSSSSSSSTATTTSTAPAASSSAAPSAPSTALSTACTRYEGSRSTARQVAASAAKPILAAGPALFLINLRQVAVDAAASVPESAAVFTELSDSIDDLNNQATAAVPPGADAAKTLVTVQPARLSAALDAIDKLCAPR